MTLYVYHGHHSVYTQYWAPLYAPGNPYNETYRHVYQFASAWLLLLLLPLGLAKWGLRFPLRQLGLQLGDWRFGLVSVAVGVVVLTPILYVGSFDPAIQHEYPLSGLAGCAPDLFLLWELVYLSYYVAWEFFFRGFSLFPLEQPLGQTVALLYQVVPSTLLHIGKPESEMWAAIAGGIAFGAITLRTRSILYVILLHWYVGACTDFFSLLNMVRP